MSSNAFVSELKNLSFENSFNPYSDHCAVYDYFDAPRKRSALLKKVLSAACSVELDAIWIGRDLGYKGGRRTGLPMTDDVHLSHHTARWGVQIGRITKGKAIQERTATVVWDLLEQLSHPVFLWNVFPLHPHEFDNPFSNRAHNAEERKAGEEFLLKLVHLLQPKRLVAIGNDAQKSAIRINANCEVLKVRHPSYGGQTIFVEQIRTLYGI